MWIVVDTSNLGFLPIKHPDLFVCANLAWIECGHKQDYLITRIAEPFLNNLSEMDRMILYKHTTGHTVSQFGNGLRKVLIELANRIPVREANVLEVDMQASKIPEKRTKTFRYKPGSMSPVEGLPLEKLQMEKSENEHAIAIAPAATPDREPIRVPAPAPVAAPAKATGSAPRQANVAGLIWAVADKFWEQANKPTDTSQLLALRKKIMVDLEGAHGVKRTTSSNELGRWMKTKI